MRTITVETVGGTQHKLEFPCVADAEEFLHKAQFGVDITTSLHVRADGTKLVLRWAHVAAVWSSK